MLAALARRAPCCSPLTGHDALDTYQRILERGFTVRGRAPATLIAATPLLFTGLAAAVAFRMGMFNIGGEGQLIMGAVGASGAGLALGGGPLAVTVLAMVAGRRARRRGLGRHRRGACGPGPTPTRSSPR